MPEFDPEYDQYQQHEEGEFRPEKPLGLRSSDIYTGGSSRYIKYTDIQEWARQSGRPPRRIVVIKDWGRVELISNFGDSKGKKRKQAVLQFDVPKGDPFYGKWLGLNATNDSRIVALVGDDEYARWMGYAIQLLISETTTESGKKVPCIRVNEGIIYTPEQVKAERAKYAMAENNHAALPRSAQTLPAPPPSVARGGMTRIQDEFDRVVPPEDRDEKSGTLDEEFRQQF